MDSIKLVSLKEVEDILFQIWNLLDTFEYVVECDFKLLFQENLEKVSHQIWFQTELTKCRNEGVSLLKEIIQNGNQFRELIGSGETAILNEDNADYKALRKVADAFLELNGEINALYDQGIGYLSESQQANVLISTGYRHFSGSDGIDKLIESVIEEVFDIDGLYLKL